MRWYTKNWIAVSAFAGVTALGAAEACSPAAWRAVMTTADIACAVANAWRPDSEAMQVCRISEPMREAFKQQLAGARVGLARVGAERCSGVMYGDAGADQ